MLTFERANELFRYDKSSGKLFWKRVTTNRVKIGDEAGSHCKSTGYINVVVDGKGYTLHRIAMLLETGVYDKSIQIDHIDHDRSNNRFDNLRAVSHSENMKNQKKRCTNTTGVPGVYIRRTRKGEVRYSAFITVDFKNVFLGNHLTLDEAVKARQEAEIIYGFHPNHGQ